jgi:hypothetical protein
VTKIAPAAFLGSGVTNLTIGNSVTNLGNYAFWGCTGLTSLTIPKAVANIGYKTFWSCSALRSIFFAGNAPLLVEGSFTDATGNNRIVYYLPGTAGWGGSFGGCPAVLWNPRIQTGKAGVGQTSPVGVSVVGTPNIPFVLETAANVTTGPWTSLQTGTLTNGSVSFTDPEWTNYPSRFYRIRSP